MAKVTKNTQVYFDGISSLILAGTVYPDNSPIVLANKDKFVFEKEVDKAPVKAAAKAPEVKIEVEEPKEELLVEEPVAALEIEEVVEEVEAPVEETKPAPKKRRKRS